MQQDDTGSSKETYLASYPVILKYRTKQRLQKKKHLTLIRVYHKPTILFPIDSPFTTFFFVFPYFAPRRLRETCFHAAPRVVTLLPPRLPEQYGSSKGPTHRPGSSSKGPTHSCGPWWNYPSCSIFVYIIYFNLYLGIYIYIYIHACYMTLVYIYIYLSVASENIQLALPEKTNTKPTFRLWKAHFSKRNAAK